MLYLIGYDINTTTKQGAKRLNAVAKACCNYGQRVQNSLFECNLDESNYLKLKQELLKMIDSKEDSIRIYHLGKKYTKKIEHYGIKESLDIEDILIL